MAQNDPYDASRLFARDIIWADFLNISKWSEEEVRFLFEVAGDHVQWKNTELHQKAAEQGFIEPCHLELTEAGNRRLKDFLQASQHEQFPEPNSIVQADRQEDVSQLTREFYQRVGRTVSAPNGTAQPGSLAYGKTEASTTGFYERVARSVLEPVEIVLLDIRAFGKTDASADSFGEALDQKLVKPWRIRLSEQGKELHQRLDRGEEQLQEEAVRFIDENAGKARRPRLPDTTSGEDAYRVFDQWLNAQDVSHLNRLVPDPSGSLAPHEFAPVDGWGAESERNFGIVRALIALIVQEFQEKQATVSPLTRRLYVEHVFKSFAMLKDQAERFDRDTLRVIVDSNTIIDLLSSDRRAHNTVARAWNRLDSHYGSSMRVIVTALTVRELVRFYAFPGHRQALSALYAYVQQNEALPPKKAIRGQRAPVLQYLTSAVGPTFDDYQQYKLLEAVGRAPILEGAIRNWKPTFVPHTAWLDEGEVEAAVQALRDDIHARGPKPLRDRAPATDRHDVALLLLCNEMNGRQALLRPGDILDLGAIQRGLAQAGTPVLAAAKSLLSTTHLGTKQACADRLNDLIVNYQGEAETGFVPAPDTGYPTSCAIRIDNRALLETAFPGAIKKAESQALSVVWTGHRLLSEIASKMGIPPYLVSYGGFISWLLGQGQDTLQQWAEPYRDWIARESLDLDGEKLQRIYKRLSEIRGQEVSPAQRAGDVDGDDRWLPPRMEWLRTPAFKLQPSFFGEAGWKDRVCDASLDWTVSQGAHGADRPHWRASLQSDQALCTLGLHGVTHVDLPWAILEPGEGQGKGGRYRKGRRYPGLHGPADAKTYRLYEALTEPTCFPSVMLDFRRLADSPTLTSLLERGPGSNWFFYAPDPPVRFADDVGQAVCELAIQSGDIENAMGHKMGFLEGKVLILHTGWAARFLVTREDLSDRQNELCHAWLVHPWLTQKAAEAIADSGAIGVAIDAPMMDCPLYVARGKLAQKVRDYVFSIEYDLDESGSGIRMERNKQPMHSRGLPRGMLLFEHLKIQPADADGLYRERSACAPEMLAFYYRLDGVLDGALCKLLLRDTREAA